MSEFGPLETLFVRLRPELSSFRREAQAGIRGALRDVGTLSVPGLQGVNKDLAATGQQLRLFGNEAVSTSTRIRTAREQEVRDTVAGQVRERRALQETLVAARALASAETSSATTVVEANRLAARSAEQLGLELTHAERRAASATSGLSKLERGALAGSGAMRGLGRNVAFASLGFIGAYGFVGAVKSALEESGNLNTQITRSETVFGNSGRSVQKWSRDSSRYLGYARESALEAANAFGTIFSASGINSRQAASFAEDLTKVAAAASLARGESDPSRSEAAFRVGLTGRGRALRQYGIILDQTAIKAKAVELGLVSTTADPTKITLAQHRLAEAVVALQNARAKGTTLQQAKAEDAVTVAQQRLKAALAGTTDAVGRQATAIAAHAIIMEQGQRFVDRYGASLDTAAGRSRRFHEGVSEIKEELGNALYPSFAQATDGIVAYIRSLSEGGSRHEQFQHDLHDLATAGHDFYEVLRLLGGGLDTLARAVGGFGNLAEILGFAYAANKALVLARAIRESRLALLLLGETAPGAAASVVASETAMGAGALTLETRLKNIRGSLLALGRLGAAGIEIFIIEKLIKDGRNASFLGAPIIGGGDRYSGLVHNQRRPPKGPQGDALKNAQEFRAVGGWSEEQIYQELRREGFTPQQAQFAVVQTRDKGKFGSHPDPQSASFRFTGPQVQPVPVSPAEIRRLIAARDSLTPSGAPVAPRSAEARQQATAALNAVAKEIEHGGKITQAKAKALSQELATAVSEIGDAGFGPKQQATLVSKANRLANELADAAAGIGSGVVAALRKDRAEIRKELDAVGQEIAQARLDMQTAITDAVNSANQAERDAVQQAKANLNTLGQSLADSINHVLDAQQAKAQQAPSGPLARRLKELTDLIHEGKGTPEVIRKAKEVESELNAQQAKGSEDASARKDRINRRLADLTDELNTGKIGIAKFNREVNALLRREHVSYRAAGQSLGVAFADGFRIALRELREQARAIVATPARLRRTSTGLESQVVRPVEVLREQNRNIARVEKEQQKQLRDLIQRRHELLLKEQKDSNAIAKAQRARQIELLKLRPQAPGTKAEPTRQAREKEQPVFLPVIVRTVESRTRALLRSLRAEVGRERLTVDVRVARPRGDQERSLRLAREGGREVGVSFSTGIEQGVKSRLEHLSEVAANTVLHAIRAAKRAGKIHSPSDLSREEVGVPLGEGVVRGLEEAAAGLGDTLAAQIRKSVRQGRAAAAEREIGSQALDVAERQAERRGRPASALEPVLNREAIRRATAHPISPGLLAGELHASAQRDLQLGEERKHTRLLTEIARGQQAQTRVLREIDRDLGHKPKPNKNPRRASAELTATATHNLLGS